MAVSSSHLLFTETLSTSGRNVSTSSRALFECSSATRRSRFERYHKFRWKGAAHLCCEFHRGIGEGKVSPGWVRIIRSGGRGQSSEGQRKCSRLRSYELQI